MVLTAFLFVILIYFFLFILVFLPQQPVINLMNFWNCHEPTTTARVHHLEIN